MTVPLNAAYFNPSLPVSQRVEDLLKRMTVEEKVGQLTQSVIRQISDENPLAAWADLLRDGKIGSFINFNEGPSVRNSLQRLCIENSRLSIPLIFGFDVIHGYRTTFPISLGLSCAWDPSLIERAQAVAAREARAAGIDWVFAPMCDVARDPRWGRVAETCGEDPFLTSLYTAAQIRGFQGDNPAAPDRVAACLKHFVGYSAVVGGRDYNHTEIPESILRQSHLPPFHAGVKSGALTLMSGFHSLDGIPAVASRRALTDILREEWGFSGLVVSDWASVWESIRWGYAKDEADAARLAINAGNDMEMASSCYNNSLPSQVNDGLISEDIIDEAVRRVLGVKFQLGLFECPYTDAAAYEVAQHKPDAIALARECVAKSTVLLKNEGVLPLSKQAKRVALIGPFSTDRSEMIGCWGARGRREDVVTLAEGIRAKLSADAEIAVVEGCAISTAPRTKTLTDGTIVPDEDATEGAGLQVDAAVSAALEADVVVMAIGEPRGWTGENTSRAHLTLTGQQQLLFDAVQATGKPIISVIFSGRPLAIHEVIKKSAAVFFAWQPGVQAGNGLADLIFGDAMPSGRLSISVPRDVGQVPIYYNRYKSGRPWEDAIHYRDMSRDPLFWFGFGLSYTTFSYDEPRTIPAANGNPAKVVVSVTNTGERDGDEVVQLYIRQLSCHEAVRPEQELRGFQRLHLKAGEKAEVAFTLTRETLGYCGRDGKWNADDGTYHIWVAPHAQIGKPLEFTLTQKAPRAPAAQAKMTLALQTTADQLTFN